MNTTNQLIGYLFAKNQSHRVLELHPQALTKYGWINCLPPAGIMTSKSMAPFLLSANQALF